MSFSQQRLSVSWGCVIIALIGAGYCALLANPTQGPIPCPGTGCRLFRDFTVHGFSLWWAGTAYFALTALVCLRRSTKLALALAGLALVLDTLLLMLMLATAPCVSCLGAALLIGLLFCTIRSHAYSMNMLRPRASALFLLWLGFFIAVSATALMEQAPIWVIHGANTSERRVYFSPSCPACKDAVTVFADKAAFVPIAERESDYAAIDAMDKAIARGESLQKALDGAAREQTPDPYSLRMLLLRLRLLRNKAEVLRLGFDALPLIMVNGMPQSMLPAAAAPPGRERPGSADLPPELLGDINACGESRSEPCDPPRAKPPRPQRP